MTNKMHTMRIQDLTKLQYITKGQMQDNKGVAHCFIASWCDLFDLLALKMTLWYHYVMNFLIL